MRTAWCQLPNLAVQPGYNSFVFYILIQAQLIYHHRTQGELLILHKSRVGKGSPEFQDRFDSGDMVVTECHENSLKEAYRFAIYRLGLCAFKWEGECVEQDICISGDSDVLHHTRIERYGIQLAMVNEMMDIYVTIYIYC